MMWKGAPKSHGRLNCAKKCVQALSGLGTMKRFANSDTRAFDGWQAHSLSSRKPFTLWTSFIISLNSYRIPVVEPFPDFLLWLKTSDLWMMHFHRCASLFWYPNKTTVIEELLLAIVGMYYVDSGPDLTMGFVNANSLNMDLRHV